MTIDSYLYSQCARTQVVSQRGYRKSRIPKLFFSAAIFICFSAFLLSCLSAAPFTLASSNSELNVDSSQLRAMLRREFQVEDLGSASRVLSRDVVGLTFRASGYPTLDRLVSFESPEGGAFFSRDQFGRKVRYTIDPELQSEAQDILESYTVPWGALVAIEPGTGKVLALASYSETDSHDKGLVTRGGFPAASLFKMITAAAAVERAGLTAEHVIHYRGGDYTLTRHNGLPDTRLDRRSISLASALGKSCNPAFARIAVNNLSQDILKQYSYYFGFGEELPYEVPVELSAASIPADDYQIGRTAAGFGNVTISPIHAAVIAATIANRGTMMRPYLVDLVSERGGEVKYRANPVAIKSSILPSTAEQLLAMMGKTVKEGTASRQFRRMRSSIRRKVEIAAKTGTLRGEDPKGVYHWFVAAAPVDNPRIAVAALVIDPGNARISGSGVGRVFLERYFRNM